MKRQKLSQRIALGCAILVGVVAGNVLADGTETLGVPSIAIQPGTGIVAAGTGMVNAPGMIDITVPAGASVEQVILYWEGASLSPAGITDVITVNGVAVQGDLIGGWTPFFEDPPGTDVGSQTYRADITAVASANGWIVPGPNSLTIDGFDFDYPGGNDGAGVLVIYDDGSPLAELGVRDGNDLAFLPFAPPLDTTVPQTFVFAAAGIDRTADLAFFVGSVEPPRSSTIRVEVDGTETLFFNLLIEVDGPHWDTVLLSVPVPAGATTLTMQVISGGPGPDLPASLSWITGAFAIMPVQPVTGTIIIEKVTSPAGGAGFGFTDDIAPPNSFTLNDGQSEIFLDVPSGGYLVTEDDPAVTPGGWDLANIVCVDDDPAGNPSSVDVGARQAIINLDPGETVTCTYLNTQPGECQVSGTEKGSLLIFSKVDLWWAPNGQLIQDTFIDLTNDYPGNVLVQMYFVQGDPPLEATEGERAHPGWNWVDVQIELTANEPTYWSAARGLPKGVSPFTVLDPAGPGQLPGRPDPAGTNFRVLRGFIVAYAVNADGEEIRWNHLKGDAMIVNYLFANAWEYNAWSFKALDPIAHGAPTGTPGVLNLDGVEYCQPYDFLLLDFYASGSFALSLPGERAVFVDTDLTLHPVDMDLRQETEGPVTTKANFEVWNMNEVKLTGTHRCITCWDQTFLSLYDSPNHFLVEFLGTAKGKARIDGLASQLCDFDYDLGDQLPLGDDPRDIVSQATPLLGLAAKYMIMAADDIDGGGFVFPVTAQPQREIVTAGTNLVGMGTQSAVIQVDVGTSPPPEKGTKVGGRTVGLSPMPPSQVTPIERP